MGCDVCIGGGDSDGYAEFMTTQTPVARKLYQCLECGGAILPGARYFRCTYKFDGAFHSDVTCILCSEIISVFSCGEAHPVGQLWAEMKEHAFPDLTFSSECFLELSSAAKTYVLRRWQEWKGL